MPTTSSVQAQLALKMLDDCGVEYALLHNAKSILNGEGLSDVDVVVRDDPWEIVARAVRNRRGLRLAMLWEYDFGALTTFWTTNDGSEGVQLDLLRDASGKGKYRVRTDALLAHVDSDVWPPRLTRPAELVYLLSKRMCKGDHDRAAKALEELASLPDWERLVARISPRRCASVRRALSGKFPGRAYATWMTWRSRLSRRGIARLRFPAGLRLRLPDCDSPEAVRDRFDRVLVRVVLRKAPRWNWDLHTRVLLVSPTLVLLTSRRSDSIAGKGSLPHTTISARIVDALEAVAVARVERHHAELADECDNLADRDSIRRSAPRPEGEPG